MPPLRQRRIEALQRRGRSARTQKMEGRAVRPRAAHAPTSPEHRTAAARRPSCLSRTPVTPSSRRASTLARCGSTLCDAQTRHTAWPPRPCVRPPQERTLPARRSMAAVHPLRQGGRCPRSRGCLRTRDAWGRRLQEGTHVPVPALESARLVVPVRGGTGAHERSVPLPPPRRASLRPYGTPPRNPGWLVPAPGRRGLGRSTASTPRPRHSVQDAWRAALPASGLPQRAAGHP